MQGSSTAGYYVRGPPQQRSQQRIPQPPRYQQRQTLMSAVFGEDSDMDMTDFQEQSPAPMYQQQSSGFRHTPRGGGPGARFQQPSRFQQQQPPRFQHHQQQQPPMVQTHQQQAPMFQQQPRMTAWQAPSPSGVRVSTPRNVRPPFHVSPNYRGRVPVPLQALSQQPLGPDDFSERVVIPEPKEVVAEPGCICARKVNVVFCPACGWADDKNGSRVRRRCTVHPKTLFIADFEKCPECSEDLVEQ